MERLYAITRGLRKRFPAGDDPFQMIARLAEECGELAAAVNHIEGSGVKQEKHGAPDKVKLAKEVKDVLRCALTIATFYGIEDQVQESIERSYRQMLAEGLID